MNQFIPALQDFNFLFSFGLHFGRSCQHEDLLHHRNSLAERWECESASMTKHHRSQGRKRGITASLSAIRQSLPEKLPASAARASGVAKRLSPAMVSSPEKPRLRAMFLASEPSRRAPEP